MTITSSPATKTLLATILILSSRLVQGTPYEDFPSACNDSTLTLDGSIGSTLGKNFIVLPQLKCLAIPHSGVKSMEDGAFDGVPNLIYLNLRGNLIPPDQIFSFGKFPNLQTLVMSDQQTSSEIKTLLVKNVYSSLKTLILRDTRLKTISVAVQFPFPAIEYMDLSWNGYTVYRPMDKMFHASVTYLDLSHNLITLVTIPWFSNLVTLRLDDNKIQSIGNVNDLNLRGLERLENLSLANNRIGSINRTAFNETVNLRYLNLTGNSLTWLEPETFSALTSLEVLVLDCNMFITVPFKLPPSLLTVSMNYNNISYLIMESLYKLPLLKKLALGGNQISSIDRTMFLSQGSLEELYLNDNRLSDLPSYWDVHLKSLRYLNLGGNNFTHVESVFTSKNRPLREVYLDGNPIATIDRKVLKVIPDNVTIYLFVGMERPDTSCAL